MSAVSLTHSPIAFLYEIPGQWEPPPGVDLLVTNLDNKMTRKELKRLLSAAISKHAQVGESI